MAQRSKMVGSKRSLGFYKDQYNRRLIEVYLAESNLNYWFYACEKDQSEFNLECFDGCKQDLSRKKNALDTALFEFEKRNNLL